MVKQVLLCGTCSAIVVDHPDEYGWIYCDQCNAIHDSRGRLVSEGEHNPVTPSDLR